MASRVIFFFMLCHFLLEKPRAWAISSLLGSHDPKEPTTRGSIKPRCLYFSILLAFALSSPSALLIGTVTSMMVGGLVDVTTRSGLSAEFSTAWLMAMEWPSFSVSSAMNVKMVLCRLMESAEFTWQPLTTWSVVSVFEQPRRHVFTVDIDPGPPRTGRIPSLA